MAGNKTVTSYLAPYGIVLAKEEGNLSIKTTDKSIAFAANIPGLHLRVLEAVKESQKGAEPALLKPDAPYVALNDQLVALGVEEATIPASLLQKFRLMKEATAEVTETTRDFGEAFNGVTITSKGEIYIRMQTSDIDSITELAEKYPNGADSESGDEVLFIYGKFHGATKGYCPPINPDIFEVAPAGFSNDDLGAGSRASSQFGDDDEDEDDYSDIGRERLSAKELHARDVINAWVCRFKFGDRFRINSAGEFETTGVMSQFATQRFAEITMFANPQVFKLKRSALGGRLLDAAEENGGQINALRVAALCMKGSKLNAKPNWPLFLKFLESVVPQSLNYLGGRFVLKTGMIADSDFDAQDDFEI